MFKFLKWYWDRAQKAAAQDILNRSMRGARRLRRPGPENNVPIIAVELDSIEGYIMDTYVNKKDDGIQNIPQSESSERAPGSSDT